MGRKRDPEYTANVSVVNVRALRIIRRDIEAKVRSDKLLCLLLTVEIVHCHQ